MTEEKILIIEDDADIRELIRYNLAREGYQVTEAADGKAGLEAACSGRFGLILLDLMLPGLNGLEICKALKGDSGTGDMPIIMVTAKGEEADIVIGLELGADDYVVKPFNYLTLLARIKAVLRRTEKTPLKMKNDAMISPRLKIDFVNQKVKVDDRLVTLTPLEYRLLVLLVKNKDRAVSYKRITEEIWDKSYWGDTENIRIYVRRLRKKLKDAPPRMILTKRGAGYMFKS